jgi:hypothetical protein
VQAEPPKLKPGHHMALRFESMAVTKIDLFFHTEYLTSATGFFYRFGQTIALVTNWHVLSGVHPIFLGTRDPAGRYPTKALFNFTHFDNESGIAECRKLVMTISDNGRTKWFQHVSTKPLFDVAWIDVADAIPDFADQINHIVCVPAHVLVQENGIANGYPPVTSDIFVLGFPKGLQLQGAIPVWKRGTIASEPLFATDGKPIILVDAVTRDGMSGAPVLYFGSSILAPGGKLVSVRGGEPWLVGVYAGREGVTKNEVEMALGRVWRRDVLDDSFFNKRQGLNPSSPDWKDFKCEVEEGGAAV